MPQQIQSKSMPGLAVPEPFNYLGKSLYMVKMRDGTFRLVRVDTLMNDFGGNFETQPFMAGARTDEPFVDINASIPSQDTRTYTWVSSTGFLAGGVVRVQLSINEDGSVGSYSLKIKIARNGTVIASSIITKNRANDTIPLLYSLVIPPTQFQAGDTLEIIWEYLNVVVAGLFRTDEILLDPFDFGFEPVVEFDW